MTPLRDELVGTVSTALWVVFSAVGFLLLIACANVANLMLARATSREQEIAVRTALGCSRWRLVRQLLTESVVFAIVGGIAGLLLAWWGISVFHSVAPRELPRAGEIHIDTSILLFGLALSLATGLLFGLAPALRASRGDLIEAMKSGAGSGRGRSHSRLANLLVTVQIMLAFVLAVGTGLLGKSFVQLMRVDPGFDFHNVLTLTTVVYGPRYRTWEEQARYYQQVIQRVQAMPGVENAAMVNDFPFSRVDPQPLHIQDRPLQNEAEALSVNRYLASPDYFRVMRIPLMRGRAFTDQDDLRAPPVAIISESCALALFPNQDPIGKSIRVGSRGENSPWARIVAISGDVRGYGLDRAPAMAVYLPQAQNESYYRMVIRTKGKPLAMLPAVRRTFRELDPTQPIWHILPLEAYIDSSLARRKFTLVLAGLFGALALLLASVGIYGVIAYTVGIRTREIGIRIALGAGRLAVLWMILRESLSLVSCGLAAGLLFTLALTRFLSHLLYQVRPMDAATISAVAIVLVCSALAASYLPARRAAAIDPIRALRYE